MSYRVLARKYRPVDFSGLIGQETLVRTLTNAINIKRIPHAFVLTGIRGVGKTTTARIIARALNCIGADGQGGETADPCGVCPNCTAISESRHVDVLEMDAASRTGVGDIREIIETVQYLPTLGRYKIYIIDEVHMLSKSAFNALLKTLEEPPPHVKFIFATTEIRKIPVTILSRCMRFDLARVEPDVLIAHLAGICGKENVSFDEGALRLIADAAEGSVRDSLSILDQAMALTSDKVDEATVRQMLGMVGFTQIFDVLEPIFKGEVPPALAKARGLYQNGADPVLILEDMMEVTHLLSQLKIAPVPALSQHLGNDAGRAQTLAEALSVPFLARTWQALMKGLEEVKHAPHPMMALEMALIRLAYLSELPPPKELIKKFEGQSPASTPAATQAPAKEDASLFAEAKAPAPVAVAAPVAVSPQPLKKPEPVIEPMPQSFKEMVALFKKKDEHFLYHWLQSEAFPIFFEPGRVEFRLSAAAPSDLSGRVGDKLKTWTGKHWLIAVSNQQGSKSLKQEQDEIFAIKKEAALAEPAVQALLSAFPGASVTGMKEIETAPEAPAAEDILKGESA